jgi:hypothetical protein
LGYACFALNAIGRPTKASHILSCFVEGKVWLMKRMIVLFGALFANAAVAQTTTPPVATQNAAPAQQERSISERAGDAVGKAAEETTSAFGRALQWTGRQLEGAGQWTTRQGATIAPDAPAATPAAPAAPAPALPPPVPAR